MVTAREEIEDLLRAGKAYREQARIDRDAGLADAKQTIVALWQQHDDPAKRAACKRALEALVMAEMTVQAAVAFVSASTPRERSAAYERLCTSTLVENPRKKP